MRAGKRDADGREMGWITSMRKAASSRSERQLKLVARSGDTTDKQKCGAAHGRPGADLVAASGPI